MEIEIKRIGVESISLLQDIARRTFFETFSGVNSAENMHRYLDENLSVETLRNELEHPESQFYIAFQAQRPVGYLKVNTGSAQTELKTQNSFELERIYVLKEFQGKFIGFLLFEKAKELFLNSKCEYVWLGVWEHNTKALNFYKKLGFVQFDQHVFKLGEEEQIDFMMKWIR